MDDRYRRALPRAAPDASLVPLAACGHICRACAPDLVPGALHRGTGAAVGVLLAVRAARAEGEAAPAGRAPRCGCSRRPAGAVRGAHPAGYLLA